jgi:hypothetical protein
MCETFLAAERYQFSSGGLPGSSRVARVQRVWKDQHRIGRGIAGAGISECHSEDEGRDNESGAHAGVGDARDHERLLCPKTNWQMQRESRSVAGPLA